MPHVSNNNDPLLDRAIFAHDGTNYRVVSVNTSGQLVAAVATGQTIKVTQDTAANLLATVNLATDQNVQARAHGYDGANWRKLQQLWGYTDRWFEQVSNLNAAAGTNVLTGTAVPAGYVYILKMAAAIDGNSATTGVLIRAILGGTSMTIQQAGATGAAVNVIFNGEVVLKAGDQIAATFTGCTLNDDIFLSTVGYQMKIND